MKKTDFMLFLALNITMFIRLADSIVPQDEVEALEEIMSLMGATNWRLNGNSCQLEPISQVLKPHPEADVKVGCDIDCNNENSTNCHVVSFVHKFYSLNGVLPRELVKLPYLQTIDFAYNFLGGKIPPELGSMRLQSMNLEANNFSGTIPSDLGKLINLQALILSSNRLTGMLPPSFAELTSLMDFRISDNNFSGSIPNFLQNWRQLSKLELIGTGLRGPIPSYISLLRNLTDLRISDISGPTQPFPPLDNANGLLTVVLRNCNVSGEIPAYIWQRRDLQLLDVSFNKLVGGIAYDIIDGCSLHVNSGGNDIRVREKGANVLFEGDASFDGGAGSFHKTTNNWGLSSTGDFLDDNIQTNRYVESLQNETNLPSIYTTARLSPLSLTYISYCLENGDYIVDLHFAEIQYTNDSTYRSLGRRVFDIYMQGKLVKREFNIEDVVGIRRPLVLPLNATVTNNMLEIRFYWAGKGTTRFPKRGRYGPIVSAISVNPYSKICSTGGKKTKKILYVGFAIAGLCLVLIISAVIWWKGCPKQRKSNNKDFEGLELKTVSFSFKQLNTATNNFDASHKLGEGGFGPGTLRDGTVVAVKQLSSRSRQGNREFLTEIGVISCLQHPNLVKLYGCCVEEDQLLLVYEYLENNSLANALFGSNKNQIKLDWPTRFKICVGIARGLAFLHEESRLKIVHRDIKATNVLLDKDLNPKISDFGLARLDEDEHTHVSTRVAGTIGYMAPEYALWGHLSDKADVYSFGVVALEIVSGKNNNKYIPHNDSAYRLQTSEKYDDLLDERLESRINKEEAERMVKVALLCTSGSPSTRPTMSEVVNMLEGMTRVPEIEPEVGRFFEDLRFKTMRDGNQAGHSQSSMKTQYSDNTGKNDTRFLSTSSNDRFQVDFISQHD
ncbi:hypothetical protein LXL04_034388 [Taraxacum kok-saghyz]